MRFFRGSLFIRCVVLLALVSFLSACHKWVLYSPVESAIEAAYPNPVRLTLPGVEEPRIELSHPRIEADSVVGVIAAQGRRIAIPIEQVQAVELKRTDGGKTVLLTIGIVGVAFGLFIGLAAIAISGSDCFPFCN
jgi:hypothetical protein